MRSRLALLLLVVVSMSCATRRPPGTVNPNPPAIARFEHVFVVVEENQSYEDVIGNTTDMPYLNTLATNYGVATNYYANTHPSLNNYFYLTAGRAGTRPPWVRLLADEFPGEVGGGHNSSTFSPKHKTWKGSPLVLTPARSH